MLHKSLAILAIAGLTGCAASVEPIGLGDSGRQVDQRAQLAAYAAAEENQYPQDAEVSDDMNVAAIVYRDSNTIRVYNFSDQTLRNAKLWINQNYVHRLDKIPANSSVRVNFGGLYKSDGRTFAQAQAPITSVQLQADDSMYRVQGPAYE